MLDINGVKLAFDMLDADTAERYEQALAAMEKAAEVSGVKEDMGLAKNIRCQCQAIFAFFNTVFGEGADRKLFGDKTNLGLCLDAYDQVVDAANAQRIQYESRLEKYYSAARAVR